MVNEPTSKMGLDSIKNDKDSEVQEELSLYRIRHDRVRSYKASAHQLSCLFRATEMSSASQEKNIEKIAGASCWRRQDWQIGACHERYGFQNNQGLWLFLSWG